MHSSRMRTGRPLTVCWRLLPEGGLVWSGGEGRGGVCSGGWWVCCRGGGGSGPLGGSGPGGVCSGGGGCIPACTEANPPPVWTESQTPVKTLPWPNFVAAGKNLYNSECTTYRRALYLLAMKQH